MNKRLRGINFGGWFSQVDAIIEKDPQAFTSIDQHMQTFLCEDDFARINNWGFNHVRLPIDSYLFFDSEERPLEERFLYLDKAVSYAANHNLTLIIDLHECPGHDFADITKPVQKLFSDPFYLQKAEKIWSYIAERYSSNSHVIFEVLNEPVAPDAEVWNSIKDSLCLCVRKHAPKSPIITGSNMWHWPSTYNKMTPVDLESIIYCFHFYEPLLFTHQNAPWVHEPEIKISRTYPQDYGKGFTRKYGFVMSSGKWDRERITHELEPVFSFADHYNVSVICNEFGVYAPVPLEYQIVWMKDLLSILSEKNIGFSYWNYKNLDFGIISINEKLHEKLPQYSNPQKTNHEILSILQKF